jgi:hypothetical protein
MPFEEPGYGMSKFLDMVHRKSESVYSGKIMV